MGAGDAGPGVADPALTALFDIERGIRALYEARPGLADHPEFVAGMLRDISIQQATFAVRMADLMRRINAHRAAHTPGGSHGE